MATLKNTTINDTGYFSLPVGTLAQRPSPSNGMYRYRSDLSRPEIYANSQWQTASFPYLYYSEGAAANLYTGYWSNSTVTTMTQFGGLGQVTAHGYSASSTYTLSLSSLPSHSTIRYKVFWHLVDSLDNETNYLYCMNSTGAETEILRFTKVYNGEPSISVLASGASAPWLGGMYYSYRPWASGAYNQDGYLTVDTGYYSHSLSTFTARHVIGADQPASDEAEYLSHVQVWLGSN